MARWFEEHRLEWIAEMLRIYGFINREHVMRKFGVSKPQAATDFKTFQCRHPGAMSYDRVTKRYVARESRQRGAKRV